MSVRPVRPDEAAALATVLRDADLDSGRSGSHYHSYPAGSAFDVQRVAERLAEAWARPVGEAGWGRAWTVEGDGALLGQLCLRGRTHGSELHRCTLGMGLLPEARGIGLGSELLSAALSWTRAEPAIDWVDLWVYEDNPRAIRLYERVGFQRIGRRPDAYRVDGATLDELSMTLPVATG